ncbi:hypothetical protein CM19_05135 [Candidatus Acidianus copahuensis]|uniref:Uncharacterized protein n=1 Tax=Candidatus Acidianus copahuensis TaxID=1160895 RepID=A0A031LN68_9CREN|nr:hypothetical protein CM19_05135 [Candidatus Acidianus copahuensis]
MTLEKFSIMSFGITLGLGGYALVLGNFFPQITQLVVWIEILLFFIFSLIYCRKDHSSSWNCQERSYRSNCW